MAQKKDEKERIKEGVIKQLEKMTGEQLRDHLLKQSASQPSGQDTMRLILAEVDDEELRHIAIESIREREMDDDLMAQREEHHAKYRCSFCDKALKTPQTCGRCRTVYYCDAAK